MNDSALIQKRESQVRPDPFQSAWVGRLLRNLQMRSSPSPSFDSGFFSLLGQYQRHEGRGYIIFSHFKSINFKNNNNRKNNQYLFLAIASAAVIKTIGHLNCSITKPRYWSANAFNFSFLFISLTIEKTLCQPSTTSYKPYNKKVELRYKYLK